MSLLPGQILPPNQPLGKVQEDGTVLIEQNWWLLIYNLVLQTLGTGSGLPADALIDLESADIDASNADAVVLRRRIADALVQAIQPGDIVVGLADLPDLQRALLQVMHPSDVVTGTDDLPDLQRALLLAQDVLPPEPIPLAPPAQTATVGASPYSFTAPSTGTLSINGGTVSATVILRQGTGVSTGGLINGLVPMCRGDVVRIIYSVAPTVVFLPFGM